MLPNLMNATIDTLTLLKDAGAVAASGAAQVSGAAKILDLGATLSPTAGMGNAPITPAAILIDVSAITATADNIFRLCFQASSSSTFASDIVNCAVLELSQSTNQLGTATVVGTAGRYILPVVNWQNKVYRRYVRMYHVISGAGPSINYTAALVPFRHNF